MHRARRIPSFVCLSDWKLEISDWKWLVWPNFAIFFRFYLKCPEMSIIGNFPLEMPRKTAEPRCLSFIFGYRSDLFNKTLAQETRTESQSIVLRLKTNGKGHQRMKTIKRFPVYPRTWKRRRGAPLQQGSYAWTGAASVLDEALYEFWDGVYWNLLESIESTCVYIYRYVYIWGWSIESIGTLSFPTVHRIHLQQNHPAEARLTKCSRLKYILDTRSYSQIWFTQITHDHLSMHFFAQYTGTLSWFCHHSDRFVIFWHLFASKNIHHDVSRLVPSSQ